MATVTIERQEDERRHRTIALIITTVFYVVLFIILSLLIMGPPDPPLPPPDGGIEINFGTSETGSGEFFERTGAEEISPNPTPPEPEPTPQEVTPPAPDPIETTDEPTEVTVPPQPKKTQPKNDPKPEPPKDPEPPKPKINPGSLYKGKSANDGNTGGDGDQGDTRGNPSSKSRTGAPGSGGSGSRTGSDIGNGFELSGRGLVRDANELPHKQVEGVIRVQIYVNRQGEVIDARISLRGTTITDPELQKAALEEVRKVRFTAKPDADEPQVGYYTFRPNLR